MAGDLDAKRWKSDVRVELGGRLPPERRPSVFSASGRRTGGPRHKKAREACIAVLKGEQPPRFARQAFVEAAREAGILVVGVFPG
ncbi:MAG: DUF982 domain-containing protein [Mesorhizobium sp.]|uniref:DUF982 domain-containing protein n=2 Tax=Mesorhizobium sp. TaxID=1871066 RepID=UPI000FCA0B94|nr:DUF982 domain-containing protein [Mesorhizobium sp.]RUV53911.1 DUF982 domain-containing protein [Mesorhizobium sp. M5C.F.Ca.IN.020.29.1.1]TGT92557.1 DUF982 domain-containing protein [Mesorhizobium sp. M5C.F.Ca.ET.164.01.1.1]RWA95902.1 MAG: DUF982 domain-containing protein [Mesorhizobium sp.]RWC07604.1 MAG: DUF982 domain-containing protein [Mesorhizobium sp.]RWE51811.1 MAG: DUF982 domain-containing protein [Mesorhizobium sp.]